MDEEQNDVTIEETNGGEGMENQPEEKIAKMREELSVCRKEKQEYMDGWQRAKADYVNLLRRTGEDAKASEWRGKIKAVEMLLPAFDALERAREHGEVPEGFVGITKQLESAFAALGLEEVGRVGEAFDPALHEAFGQDKAESLDADDTITTVLEKGWKIGEQIIRPAKVRVAHYSVQA